MSGKVADLEQKIKSAIQTVLNNPALAVQADTRLIGDLNFQSVDLLDLSFELAKITGKEIRFQNILRNTAGSASAPDISVSELVEILGG